MNSIKLKCKASLPKMPIVFLVFSIVSVKSWNGTQSALEREIEEEKNESTKRSYSDVYNDDFDRGKVRSSNGSEHFLRVNKKNLE